jgi:hypothetical protein
MTWRRQPEAVHAGAALGAVAVVTVVLGRWLEVSNAAVASTTYLMIVLVVAATSRLRVAVATSIAAMLSLNDGYDVTDAGGMSGASRSGRKPRPRWWRHG